MTEVRPGVWRLRVMVQDPATGKPRQLSRTFDAGKPRGTKQAAADALQAFRDEARAGEATGPAATVGALLDDWLAEAERVGVARSTLDNYRQHAERHIRPGLGSLRLDQLGLSDVTRYLGDLAETKRLAPSTIELDLTHLRAALNHGVDRKWIAANPARKARPPKARTKVKAAMTGADVGRLCNAARDRGDIDEAAAIALAAITGCRLGEICGLRWSDIAADQTAVRVERHFVSSSTGGGQYLEDATKNGKDRTVHIGAGGVALLERYREAKREQLGREPAGWLISSDGGTTPTACKSLSAYFSALAKRLKVDATFRSLRSWKQSELNRLNVDLATAAAQGGHTVEVMARSYLRTNDEQGAAAGELIAGVVTEAIGA